MRILISSRNILIPSGIQQLLSASEHEVKSHFFESEKQLIAKAILERSDLVFLDKGDAETFTFEEVEEIKLKLPRLKLLVISAPDYLDFIQKCYTSGVHGYLTYDCSQEEMDEAIATIGKDRTFYCQKILTRLLNKVETPEVQPVRNLTPREMEIARLIADGMTNKTIGDRLCISPHTVHTHRKSLMKKLEVSSARELALVMVGQRAK